MGDRAVKTIFSLILAASLAGCGAFRPAPDPIPVDSHGKTEIIQSQIVQASADSILKLGMTWSKYADAVEKLPVINPPSVAVKTPSVVIPAAAAQEFVKTTRKAIESGKVEVQAVKDADTAKTANFEAMQKASAEKVSKLESELQAIKDESARAMRRLVMMLSGVCLVGMIACLIGSYWVHHLAGAAMMFGVGLIACQIAGAALALMAKIGVLLAAAALVAGIWWLVHRWRNLPPQTDSNIPRTTIVATPKD